MSATTGPREPTLREVVLLLGQGWMFMLGGAVLGLLAAVVLLSLSIPQYRASMIIAPTTRTGTTDMDGPRSSDSSFATEYMLKSFSPGDAADFALYEHIVRGPRIAALLLKNPAITEGVARDRAFTFEKPYRPQTPEDLAGWLEKHVVIEPMGSTMLRHITYDHPDRTFAIRMLAAMTIAADALIRDEMKDKADKRISWLRQTISRTENPDYRRALTSLLMEQEQIRMMLVLDEPYAARVAEPPTASTRPSWPRKALFLPVFTMCGLLLGMALFGAKKALKAV